MYSDPGSGLFLVQLVLMGVAGVAFRFRSAFSVLYRKRQK